MARRHVLWGTAAAALLSVIAVLTVVLLTMTDFGRAYLSRVALGRLAERINGNVEVGEVRGNLLTGATLVDLRITDPEGRLFLEADTVQLRYGIRALLRKRLEFRDVRFVRPVVLLDQLPGQDWNYQRIFPADTMLTPGDTVPGFGSWVNFVDLTVVGGTIEVRREWKDGRGRVSVPDPGDLAWPENRYWIERAHGGLQLVSLFHHLDARIPRLRFAHPDTAARLLVIDSLRMLAMPFLPPAAHVLDMTGRVTLWEDTVAFEDLDVKLPKTELEVDGFYAFGQPDGTRLHVEGGPLELASLRWLRPSLPEGGGKAKLDFEQGDRVTRLELSDMDMEAEGATVEGSARMSFTDRTFEVDRSDFRFEGVDTRLIERTIEEVQVPIDGVLAGDVRLSGTPDALDVDGWGEVAARGGGTSRLEAEGGVSTRDGTVVARGLAVRMNPLRLGLLREWMPSLPLTGALTGRATLDGPLQGRFRVNADVEHVGTGDGPSHLRAEGTVRVLGGLEAQALDVRFDPLQVGLLRAFSPDFPLDGTFAGRALLNGSRARGFEVDADVLHDSGPTGRSRVLANGDVRLANGLELRGLHLRMDPLQVRVLRVVSPDLPLDGVLVGDATLTGSLRGRLTAELDVQHQSATGPSTLGGTATVDRGGGKSVFDADLSVRPLSLATLGLFVPAAALHGSATGRLALDGTADSARVDLSLDVDGGGSILARGTVGVGDHAHYQVTATVTGFDAAAASARAPHTALTGRVDVAGVGTDPLTANARIDAHLVDSGVEGTPTLDETRVRARLAEGLLILDEGRLRLRSGTADVTGSVGLVPERSGALAYRVEIGSLAEFRHLLPDSMFQADSLADRPLPRLRGLAEARADSARASVDSLVASAATRRAPPIPLPLDTAAPLPRDSLSGSLRIEGTVEGSLQRFAARGTAAFEEVVFGGYAVGNGELAFAFTDPRSQQGFAELDLAAQRVRAVGFVFDSAAVRLRHEGGVGLGGGRVEIDAFQDEARDYRVAADYTLATDANVLFLQRVAMRFGESHWNSAHPGVVRWGGGGLAVEQIELTSDRGGRIYANGLLPDGTEGDLTLDVRSFEITHLTALLQDTLDTRGILDLQAHVTGSLRAPRFEGTLRLDSLYRGGVRLPALTSSFRYHGEQLTASVLLQEGARKMLSADVRLPVNLALKGVAGSRLLERPMEAELVADSVPLEALPELTPAVQDLSGRAWGRVSVRGTPREPRLSGELLLADATATVPDARVTLTEGRGRLRLQDDQILVDSLVATSGDGEVRVTGTIEVEEIANPVFDLDIVATNATVIRGDRGDDVQADADLEITGTLEEPTVSGEIVVQEGVIAVPEPENLRRAARLDDPALLGVYDALRVPASLRPRPSFLRNVNVQIAVRIQRDTWLRNSELSVEIYTPELGTPLHISSDSTTGALVLEGVVLTDRGEYSVAGRRVSLTTGSITFLGQPQPDPLLQLNAQYEVPRPGRQALIILVNVGGYLSSPRVSLSSNAQPPLPESDLLSFLAFGRPSSSLLASNGSGIVGDALGGLGVLAEQQLAGLGLGALTDALFTTVEREGERAGLDVFRVSGATLPDELNYAGYFASALRSIEVEAGEYFMRSRFFFSTKLRPSGGGIPGLFAEYRTPRGFIWRTTWVTEFEPVTPTLGTQFANRHRVFGTFFLWTRRF